MTVHAFAASRLFDPTGLPDALAALLDVEAGGAAWEVLARLDAFCAALDDDRRGSIHPTAVVEGPVVLAEGADIGPHAFVRGPAWIGSGARVHHGAYLRGGVVLGPSVHVGHASEIKRSLLLPHAKVPHFNYVGDSVVGSRVNLGAGVKLANFKTDGRGIAIAGTHTGLRKLGSLLGDDVSIGCNAVLNPGTWVGRRSIIYAAASVRGVIDDDSVVKHAPKLHVVPRRG